jgi:hypothetical protein
MAFLRSVIFEPTLRQMDSSPNSTVMARSSLNLQFALSTIPFVR